MPDNESVIHVADEDVSLLSLAGNPNTVIGQAREAANAVMDIILTKPHPVKFNNEIYLENDDWVLAARFFGITVRIVKDEYVEFGNVKGFQAEAEAYLVSTGQVIGRAYAMCLDDEDNWGYRTKYEWQDELGPDGKKIWEEKIVKGKKKNLPRSKRLEVAKVKVPLFQLRSMAQTRSSSKVLSMLLKFIPVLASSKGIRVSTTPAEEAGSGDPAFLDSEPSDTSYRPTRAKRKENAPEGQQTPANGTIDEWGKDPDCISKEQGKTLWRLATGVAKYTQDEVRIALAEFKGKDGQPLKHTHHMINVDYDKFMGSLPNVQWKPEDVQEEPGANG